MSEKHTYKQQYCNAQWEKKNCAIATVIRRLEIPYYCSNHMESSDIAAVSALCFLLFIIDSVMFMANEFALFGT